VSQDRVKQRASVIGALDKARPKQV